MLRMCSRSLCESVAGREGPISATIRQKLAQRFQSTAAGDMRYKDESEDVAVCKNIGMGDRLIRVSVSEFKGYTKVDIRHLFIQETTGQLLPTKRGVSLSPYEWKNLKEVIAEVDEELSKRNAK